MVKEDDTVYLKGMDRLAGRYKEQFKGWSDTEMRGLNNVPVNVEGVTPEGGIVFRVSDGDKLPLRKITLEPENFQTKEGKNEDDAINTVMGGRRRKTRKGGKRRKTRRTSRS